jgi:hypothetical protein
VKAAERWLKLKGMATTIKEDVIAINDYNDNGLVVQCCH